MSDIYRDIAIRASRDLAPHEFRKREVQLVRAARLGYAAGLKMALRIAQGELQAWHSPESPCRCNCSEEIVQELILAVKESAQFPP